MHPCRNRDSVEPRSQQSSTMLSRCAAKNPFMNGRYLDEDAEDAEDADDANDVAPALLTMETIL